MNKREWLASQGLAEIGKRGRFSREAEAAWAAHVGQVEEVPAGDMGTSEPELPRDGIVLAKLPEDLPVVRKEDQAYTIDSEGRMINHGNCGKCYQRINKCPCEGGPWGLKYIKPEQQAYIFVGE